MMRHVSVDIPTSTASAAPQHGEASLTRVSRDPFRLARCQTYFFVLFLALAFGVAEYATLAFLVPLGKNDTLTRTSLP
jgi:hypothetical protein